jgi:hypothetical protein
MNLIALQKNIPKNMRFNKNAHFHKFIQTYYLFNMELVVEPDIYSPSIDDKGNYISQCKTVSNLLEFD